MWSALVFATVWLINLFNDVLFLFFCFFGRLAVQMPIYRSSWMLLMQSSIKYADQILLFVIFAFYLFCFFVLTPTYNIFFLLSGQTNRFYWLWPLHSATRKPGILDIWGLPDHSASAGERHLDCLQNSYRHQLWPGKAGSLPGLGPTVYNNSHIL